MPPPRGRLHCQALDRLVLRDIGSCKPCPSCHTAGIAPISGEEPPLTGAAGALPAAMSFYRIFADLLM